MTMTTFWTLDQMLPGQRAIVLQVGGRGAFRHRAQRMGLVSGATIEMIGTAPQGDPLLFLIGGHEVSLRRAEARVIVIEL
ncbi:MAG: ferrous iron transport protein A [Anaerolineae bacterium]|nr:ferrous iron transport protein A [Anaerolineae bacterium]